MKTKKPNLEQFSARLLCAAALGIGSPLSLASAAEDSADAAPAKTSQTTPCSQLGAKAGADYKGDGLAVSPASEGARLHCVFQRLEGEATREGLWLSSTVSNAVKDRFRVVAAAVGRQSSSSSFASSSSFSTFENAGTVSIERQTIHFSRPRLVEEYSVSMDGVRQDFVVLERPALLGGGYGGQAGGGELAVQLTVSGARAEPSAFGAQLVLEGSGRKIAYSRLRVTDATGKDLTARMEVMEESQRDSMLAVLVNDADAVYPVRIDPTFSDANWISMGGIPGANGEEVRAAVADGLGNLYIGGDFTIVGDVFANRIAKWNGSSWTALGLGMDSRVNALAVSGSDVYAGGDFEMAGGSPANFIAKWNGSSWTALGSGVDGDVSALAVSGSDVYAGGDFTTAGDSAANHIAKWNGSSWTNLGSGFGSGFNSAVSALAVSGSDLYAGGGFTNAGGSAANNIAKWNGSSWSALGSGIDDYVYALALSGTTVYAGGASDMVAKWDGSSWTNLGSDVFSTVYALAVSGSDLYAGGEFTTQDGSPGNYIAKWNGSSWTDLGSGMDSDVLALAVSGSDLYAGGDFETAGDGVANHVAKWNGSNWSALGSGMGGGLGNAPYVYGLAVSGSDLYAGGGFTAAGGGPANYIAKWSGSGWTNLGSGMSGGPYPYPYVWRLAAIGSDVYAGGGFTTAGGNAAANIAKWNGSSWTNLGSGLNSDVRALAVSGSNLFVAGLFTNAGGSAANHIAKWNGSSWTNLGSGMNSNVLALAVSGSDVYAAGDFTMAGGSVANYIAKWNGSGWTNLGSGMDSTVYALAVSGSEVYAGGGFTNAGGSAASSIGKWNGSNWSALSSGMGGGPLGNPPYVLALAVSGSDLYAGGSFTMAGGNAATNTAKWNGSSWTNLGSGADGTVLALAVSGSDLFAGGRFTTAGGKVSAYIARAYLPTLPALSIRRSGTTNVMVSWPSPDTVGFALQQAHALAAPMSWVSNSASVADDGTNKSVTLPATNSPQFFRLRRP